MHPACVTLPRATAFARCYVAVKCTVMAPWLSQSPVTALRRYGLNIGFNLLNKTVFNYFPFPWTVSAIHVVVGTLYCGAAYLLGFKEASFGRVRLGSPDLGDRARQHPLLN